MFTRRHGSDHDGDNGDDAERRCGRPHSPAGHIEDPLALSLQGSAPFCSSSFCVKMNFYRLQLFGVKILKNIIRSSEKFFTFYKEIMDAQHFQFYIILSNYFVLSK